MTAVIVAAALALILIRPLGAPEAVWAVGGAALLVLARRIGAAEALAAAVRGLDVYLFLAGMMLLAELARREGLFAWLAAHAARAARGRAARLFTLVYAVGVLVTVFLSNDATAVVLTPAVIAVARAAGAAPLPPLFACAFVANAASFVLPISNPANIVLYGRALPPLATWLPRFALPSLAAIAATYLVLRLAFRRPLAAPLADAVAPPALSSGGRLAALGLFVAMFILLAASAAGLPLGLPTAAAGLATLILVAIGSPRTLWQAPLGVAWSVLPLVAGLFVFVAAVEQAGVAGQLAAWLAAVTRQSPTAAVGAMGGALGVGSNLVNNLPAGLLAARVLDGAHAPDAVRTAALIGVDLGPNLSVTGSLATILWLAALRREGLRVSAWRFLLLGVAAMPAALLLALAAALLAPW